MTPRAHLKFSGIVAVLTLVLCSSGSGAWAGEAALSSDWTEGHSSRSRITAGSAGGQRYAFIEIELEPGWKTYWRNPGDSGLPPKFDFARSTNVERAEVLYPAPMRIADPGGDIIGYKDRVIFPVKLTLKDATLAAGISADIQFGICKDICVPSEAALDVTIPASDASKIGDANTESLAAVPAQEEPLLKNEHSDVLNTKDGKPRFQITLSHEFCGEQRANLPSRDNPYLQTFDAFVEAPDGLYFPLLTKANGTNHTTRFEADLSKDVDLKALSGKTLTITAVDACGAREFTQKFE